MPFSPEAQKLFDTWYDDPPPDPLLAKRMQFEAEINAILANPDHPVTKRWRKTESELDARYYADACDDQPDTPLTPEEIAGRDWNKWPPHPPLSPEHKAASDRFRNAVDDAMGAQPATPTTTPSSRSSTTPPRLSANSSPTCPCPGRPPPHSRCTPVARRLPRRFPPRSAGRIHRISDRFRAAVRPGIRLFLAVYRVAGRTAR